MEVTARVAVLLDFCGQLYRFSLKLDFCRFQSVAYRINRLLPSLFVNEKIMDSSAPRSSDHWL